MLKYLMLLLFARVLLPGPECWAQSRFEVSEPRFRVEDNVLYISYDILQSSPSDHFDISIEILDEQGNEIEARTLRGDIGENIAGGNNKLISWNLEADQIVMNAEIEVKIHARIRPESTPAPTIAAEGDQKKFSRAGLVLQSLALPGLGLSRLTGKPHWIRGVVGYGCIAGSVILNRMAVNTYDDFLAAETTPDADSYMKKAIRQDNISEGLAYAAIGIWIADFIWTMTGTRNLNGTLGYGGSSPVSLFAGYEPLISSPVVGIQFRF